MSAQAIKKLTEKIEQLESRVEQLYKAHYNPPTNNDLQNMNIFSESINESIGLLSCSLWTYILSKRQ